MRIVWAGLAALSLIGALGPSPAAADQAGRFDYYVLAVSWTPNWCVLEGDKRRDQRCASGTGNGWQIHGLWPQYEVGWPQNCRSPHRDPSRSETARHADYFGASGLAWHQWKKHGRCSGLTAPDYFAATQRALASIEMPEVFSRLTRTTKLPARVVEEAFLEVNPQLDAKGLTVTCRAGGVQEVRICLTKDLEPRDCGRDVSRDCTLPSAEMAPPR